MDNLQPNTPKPILWLSTSKHKEHTLDNLKAKALNFEKIIFKIKKVPGLVRWDIWSTLSPSEADVILQFIRWHTSRSVNHKIEMYGGFGGGIGDMGLWQQYTPFIDAGAERSIYWDTGSSEANRLATRKAAGFFSSHYDFEIKTEALDTTGSPRPTPVTPLAKLCSWRFWYKHGLKELNRNEQIVVRLRNYTDDTPDPTHKDALHLMSLGCQIACTEQMAIQLGLML